MNVTFPAIGKTSVSDPFGPDRNAAPGGVAFSSALDRPPATDPATAPAAPGRSAQRSEPGARSGSRFEPRPTDDARPNAAPPSSDTTRAHGGDRSTDEPLQAPRANEGRPGSEAASQAEDPRPTGEGTPGATGGSDPRPTPHSPEAVTPEEAAPENDTPSKTGPPGGSKNAAEVHPPRTVHDEEVDPSRTAHDEKTAKLAASDRGPKTTNEPTLPRTAPEASGKAAPAADPDHPRAERPVPPATDRIAIVAGTNGERTEETRTAPVVPGNETDEPEAPAARSRLVTKARDAGDPSAPLDRPRATNAEDGPRLGGPTAAATASPKGPPDREKEGPVREERALPPARTVPGAHERRARAHASAGTARSAAPGGARADAALPAPAGELVAAGSSARDPFETRSAAIDGVPRPGPELILRVAPGLERQLAAKAREFLQRGETRIRVILDPPALGRLHVKLEITEGRAVARIVAATPEAAALLMREREDLVRAFHARGFDEVQVHVDSDSEPTARGRDGEDRRDEEAEDVPAPTNSRDPGRAPYTRAHSTGVDLFV